ncbi:YqhG family protein [Sporosarcina sp. HYO08]|uniref:YqhG family protein n=1 Tax=Sporosarcina sp. HYO08 TaxID=1759557 RepID=UPI00079A3C12|nr:YqhG family protein [Sporosarcina sp. HYO08]KXH81926.1 hypothetical protein AU377_06600 [Sporosarcina sp. HYO08]
MYPQQIHDYLHQFFKENNCPILSRHDHFICVQLTIEMDKRIMNRPFYWKYQESTNEEPRPAQLTLITDKNKLVEDIKGEVVHFGSPRLNQLFQVTKEKGSFVQMYEVDPLDSKAMLAPWLGVNYKVSYSSNQMTEKLYSLGIHLMTGKVIDGFHESIQDIDLSATMQENTFYPPPIIQPIRALDRLDMVIENIIEQDDHTWMEEAKLRRKKERQILEYFYEGMEDRPECYEIEKEAIDQQYETKIKIEVLSGGIFYLKSSR